LIFHQRRGCVGVDLDFWLRGRTEEFKDCDSVRNP
jgi:hypothetical protein